MSKQQDREETERLIKEAMERKAITIKQGDTRIEAKCGKCGAPNRVSAPPGTAPRAVHLQGMRAQAEDVVSRTRPGACQCGAAGHAALSKRPPGQSYPGGIETDAWGRRNLHRPMACRLAAPDLPRRDGHHKIALPPPDLAIAWLSEIAVQADQVRQAPTSSPMTMEMTYMTRSSELVTGA